MIARIVPILALLLGTMVFMHGNGLLGTLLAVRLNLAGFGPEVAGAVAASYYLGLIAGCLRAGAIVATVGHIRAFAAFAAASAAIAVAFGLTSDPIAWGLLRLVGGFAMAGLFVVIESWLNDATENEWRGRVLSAYMIVVYASLGVGQLLIGLYPVEGHQLFSLVTILFALSLIPVAMTRQIAPEAPQSPVVGLRGLFRLSPLGAVAAGASGLILGAFYGLGPVFAQDIGFAPADVGRFMSVAILGGLIVQWPIGYLADWRDRRKVLTATIWIVAASAGAVALTSFVGEAWLSVLVGVGLCCGFGLYPLAAGHANDRVPGGSRVPIIGGLVLTYAMGSAVGPLGAAFSMRVLGPYGLFAFIAAVAGLAGIYALHRMLISAPVPLEDQGAAQASPRTSPVAAMLDPEVEDLGEDYGEAGGYVDAEEVIEVPGDTR